MKYCALCILLAFTCACGSSSSDRSSTGSVTPAPDALAAYADQYTVYVCGIEQPTAVLFDPHGDMTSITPIGPEWAPLTSRQEAEAAVASLQGRYGASVAVRRIEGISDYDRSPVAVGYVLTPAVPRISRPLPSNPYALVIQSISAEQAGDGR